MAVRTSMTFSFYCLVKLKLSAIFHHVIGGCLSTVSDNVACCGDIQYCCNSSSGLICIITTDVDFHAAFVKMCAGSKICVDDHFLNLLFMKWGINHTRRARFNFCLPLHMKFEELLVKLPIQGLSWYMKLTIRIKFWFSQLCCWRCCLQRYEPVTVPYQWRTKSYN